MTKRTVGWFLGTIMCAGAMYTACGGVTGEDCKVKCSDAHNTCVQKCNDDGCKTKCTTDLNHCTASCDEVSTGSSSKPDGG
jgi:hypothetical protein